MIEYVRKWSQRKTYNVGCKVKYKGKVYISRLYSNTNVPTDRGWVLWKLGGK